MANSDHDPCWRERDRADVAERRAKRLEGMLDKAEHNLELCQIGLICLMVALFVVAIFR